MTLTTETTQMRELDASVVAEAPARRVDARRIPLRKRIMDVAIAGPALVVALPLIAGLGAASAVAFRTNPIFSQPRLGHGGKLFQFRKVRSLPPIAPDTADKYQLRSLKLPRFASTIRYRHLDELPQLGHVLSGKMSLVGPRPEMPTLAESFDPDFVDERLRVRPGCTGLWQVSRCSRKLIGEHPEFDRHYLENWTLRLDMWILARTVPAMAFHREIESLNDIPRWTGAAAE